MAELIDKNEVIEIFPDKGGGSWTYNVTAKAYIDSLPTTTEAEIIEKAISDFLQFVYDNASNEEYANEDGWAMSDLMDLEYKFVKQLKEE